MAVSTGAALLGALGAGAQIYGSNQAAGAAQSAANSANRTQLQMYNTSLQATAPQRQVGIGALNQLAALYGITPAVDPVASSYATPAVSRGGNGGGTAPVAARMGGGIVGNAIGEVFGGSSHRDPGGRRIPRGGFEPAQPTVAPPTAAPPAAAPSANDAFQNFLNSTGYQFRLNQGLDSANRSLAGMGLRNSGRALNELTQLGQGYASSEFGNYTNQLNNLAGLGQVASGQAAQGALQTGAGMANNYGNAGAARASAYTNQGNALTGLFNDLSYGMGRAQGAQSPGWYQGPWS